MRNRSSAVLVAALLVLAGVAVADAVRGTGEPQTTRSTRMRPVTTSPPTTPAEALADARLAGVLYATVRRGDVCDFQAIALPELAATTLFPVRACRLRVSPDLERVAFGAACPARRIDLHEIESDELVALDGCAPAWRPDGRLTFVRAGDVVVAERAECAVEGGCVSVALSDEELAAALQPLFDVRFANRFLLREIAWFTSTRLIAVVRGLPRREEFVVTFERDRLVGRPDVFAPSFARLRVLPRAEEAIVATVNGFSAVRADGQFLGRRSPGDVRAIAYSPDERAFAAASPGNVCFYRSGRTNFDVACLPVDAADAEWR